VWRTGGPHRRFAVATSWDHEQGRAVGVSVTLYAPDLGWNPRTPAGRGWSASDWLEAARLALKDFHQKVDGLEAARDKMTGAFQLPDGQLWVEEHRP
jgi:hypothetical protein